MDNIDTWEYRYTIMGGENGNTGIGIGIDTGNDTIRSARSEHWQTLQRSHQPAGALKRGTAEARRKSRSARRAQGVVVAASLAATVIGWAIFSHEDADIPRSAQQAPLAAFALAEAQQGSSEQGTDVPATISSPSVITTATPVPSPTSGPVIGSTMAVGGTSQSAAPSSGFASQPRAITRTRSSR